VKTRKNQKQQIETKQIGRQEFPVATRRCAGERQHALPYGTRAAPSVSVETNEVAGWDVLGAPGAVSSSCASPRPPCGNVKLLPGTSPALKYPVP
jgi:hypothetical protein